MKKVLILVLALLCIFCTACAEDAATGEEQAGKMDFANAPEGMGMPGGMEMPEGMSMPEGMEQPSGGRPKAQGSGEGKGQGPSKITLEEGEVLGKVESIAGNRVELLFGTLKGGEISYGTEVAAYLLPVGMKIGSGDFSSVTAGMVLKLSMEEASDGTETITAVTIVSR